MRPNEGSPRGVARTDPRRHPPGSRAARLAEAGKQLSILLEDVDLEAEPGLGDALTEAVVAVDRAADLSGPDDGERFHGTDDGQDGGEPRAWDRLVEDADGDRGRTKSADRRGEPRVESDGLQFVGEAGAE